MAVPVFTLEDVRYKHILKVDHLKIIEHQITTLVGSSGSGKSTLLRLLNRMNSADSGTITYRGEPIDEIDPIALRRKVVMLPQNPVMFDGSLRENLLKGLELSDREPVSDDRLHELLELMMLDKDLDGSTGRLSGGERQRVAIARVLAMQPDVLLLDEPTSALDVTTQDDVMENLVADAQTAGTTIVMVTHAMPMAERWADQLVTIQAGEIRSVTNRSAHG